MSTIFISRMIVFVLMILPLLCGIGFIVYQAGMSFVKGDSDVLSYVVLSGFIIFCLAARKYLFPYYSNLFKYAGAREKELVEATILAIRQRSLNSTILLFRVETDAGVIDSGVDVVLFPDLTFPQMQQGMRICIHRVPGMRNELVRITRVG